MSICSRPFSRRTPTQPQHDAATPVLHREDSVLQIKSLNVSPLIRVSSDRRTSPPGRLLITFTLQSGLFVCLKCHLGVRASSLHDSLSGHGDVDVSYWCIYFCYMYNLCCYLGVQLNLPDQNLFTEVNVGFLPE